MYFTTAQFFTTQTAIENRAALIAELRRTGRVVRRAPEAASTAPKGKPKPPAAPVAPAPPMAAAPSAAPIVTAEKLMAMGVDPNRFFAEQAKQGVFVASTTTPAPTHAKLSPREVARCNALNMDPVRYAEAKAELEQMNRDALAPKGGK